MNLNGNLNASFGRQGVKSAAGSTLTSYTDKNNSHLLCPVKQIIMTQSQLGVPDKCIRTDLL